MNISTLVSERTRVHERCKAFDQRLEAMYQHCRLSHPDDLRRSWREKIIEEVRKETPGFEP